MAIRVVQADQVNEGDRTYYQDNGCVIIRGLYSANEIDAARCVVEDALERPDPAKRLGDRKYARVSG
jgi:hypothetical protein